MSTSDGDGGELDSSRDLSISNTYGSPLKIGLKRVHSSEFAILPNTQKLVRSSITKAEEPNITSDRQQTLQFISSDVWKLHVLHRRHLAELLFLQGNGNYVDFETWCSSSPPQLVAYLQAHSFDVNEALAPRLLPSPAATGSGWTITTSSRGHMTTPAESLTTTSFVESTSQEPGFTQRSQDVSLTASLASRPLESRTFASSSPLLQSAASIGTVRPTILPIISHGISNSASANPGSFSSAFLQRSTPETHVNFKEGNVPTKQLGIQIPTTHRGPGRPPSKKNTNTVVNGSRYRGALASGRMEHAVKQEAAVMRRIAELRRDGLWSADKLPKCADPPRGKTHWDFLLEEVKWMAMDFEQERRWKKGAAKKLAIKIVSQKKEEDEKLRRAEFDREKELKRIASFAAKEIRLFWNNVEKVVEFKSDTILEAKRKRALDKHLDFIVGQTEKFSSLVQQDLARAVSSRPESEIGTEEPGDSDFEIAESSEDDESTLEKEENQVKESDVDEEVAMLQEECEMEFDDILKSLPAGYLEAEGCSKSGPSTSRNSVQDDDNESVSSVEMEQDAEQESTVQSQALPDDVDLVKLHSDDSDVRQQELTHFAETAEKLQPKGYTLETTRVVTKVPFLLKHQLREYQHVGLDWLVTLYERKLNGILADEMGLGKTIQTIALLAHMACEKGIWGPHLIVVPTTVMLNWEMEIKKWCPGFKILTYYGSLKERKEKRHGWSKPNAFHVCITSYKLVLQDHLVFRRKRWEYLILDEAQNIKNFKSQRWQMLLNFNAQRRLLLTGTPLQNSLMELWSLMHFLMPDIFASHRDFKDWFSNPVTDMIEGSREYNEQTIRRLHKVLRPFILRRLKAEVEKQLPKKYEHIVPCSLSKRQRYLYEDFMSRASTKDQLRTGRIMSVLNVLMQLRKVCNHPNLFESRSITSPFVMERLTLEIPTLLNKFSVDMADNIQIPCFLLLQQCRRDTCIRCRQLAPGRRLIEELDDDKTSDCPMPPVLDGYKFTPLKQPLSGIQSTKAGEPSKKKNFQFVIPPQVAQQLDFSQPFLVQVQTASGPRLVPIQLRPPANEALAKIGLGPQLPSSVSVSTPTISSDNVVQLPVWRLSQPSMFSAQTLQPPFSNIGSRASSSRMAVVSNRMGAPSTQSGLSVSLLRPPGITAYSGLNSADSPIRTRTVLFRPAVRPRMTSMPGSSSNPTEAVVRPQIMVQDVGSRTPPVVRYVVPSGEGPSSLSSKPSTPAASPATPSSPNQLASVSSILPSPMESASSEADLADKALETSPHSVETEDVKMVPSLSEVASAAGQKRAASSILDVELVAKRRKTDNRGRFQLMASLNEQRNLFEPLYGLELLELLSLERTDYALSLRRSILELGQELHPLLSRFCIFTPTVISGLPRYPFSQDTFSIELEKLWPELNVPFKEVIDSQMLQFPELRLIEYDCGKLQMLNKLLRTLKEEGHRCLIFTQMAKMLDILEAFLSYLGLKYLRLDGATPIEHRQVLMERFNQDSRIFCLILSTRSGGLGVNLTGADTVIFYDSDWNPTMDAQAQDRCHRIGQTRDVHIYRLISEKTVEENILKKAAQKRRLGEVAIEEGGFTTEFFMKKNLKEIFNLSDDVAVPVDEASLSQQDLEQQMTNLEDENDVQAARCARAEVTAEMAEFDDSQSAEADEDVDPEVEQKMKQLMSELKPVERYAVKYLEALHEPYRNVELQQTEDKIERRKQQWEMVNQERLHMEESRRKADVEEEFDMTYAYDDSLAQMFCPSEPMETMPVWMPPTPPMSDSELEPYIDPALSCLYNMEPMEEGDLPPVFGELDLFRSPTKTEPNISMQSLPSTVGAMSDIPAAVAETVANIRNSFNKTPKESHPKSLFEAGSSYRSKRDRRPVTPPSPSVTEQEPADLPEWTILEDYALFKAVTGGQQMHYTLVSSHAGHVTNWDYVSKLVSSTVGHYCSPRACCNRYQFVVLPREEGRLAPIDPVTKKPRKVPLAHQELSKKFRMRTGQQFQQEGSMVMASKLNQRFAAVRQTMAKRTKVQRERGLGLANCQPASISTRRKQDLHLQQTFGINPETALSPVQLAEMREERLKELKKQHLLQQQQQQQQQALSFHAQQHQPPNQMPFQSSMPQQQQQMHTMQSLPQYSQAVPQSQGMMDSPNQVGLRSSVPASVAYGISSVPGSLHLQQAPLDVSQNALAVHPASRLMSGTQQIRPNAGAVLPQTGSAMTHSMATGSPRSLQGVVGMGGRSAMPSPGNVTTATVYRQISASGGLVRPQRTPPSTPAPSGLHVATPVQIASTLVHPRTPSIAPSATMAPVPLTGSVSDSSSSVSAPVVVQTPSAAVRFQAVSSSAARQKFQYGSGGFMVSTDVNKPAMLSMPPVQMTSQGISASHQTASPISITGATAVRGTTVTPRQQLQLAQANLPIGGKKNVALPRIATFTHSANRGGASPVHLVASQVSSKVTTAQAVHGIRQVPSPSPLIRSQSTGITAGRNIPSISMIMPPVGRVETIPGAGVNVSSTPVQSQESNIPATSTPSSQTAQTFVTQSTNRS